MTTPDEHPTSRGLPASAWVLAGRRAWHGFLRHRGLDSAAALTFFGTLAFFPVALTGVAVQSIALGRDGAREALLAFVSEIAEPATVESVQGPLAELLTVTNPWLALGVGVVLSLWTMSGYATAFGRAVNTVYEVQEGRQIWKFRGLMLLLAVFLILGFGAVIALLLSTPRATQAIGLTEPWVTVWAFARWPILVIVVALIIAVLYYFTPNVRHDRFRWVSYGALFAMVVWALATAAFYTYIALVGQYDRIYGWLGGAIVVLLWLYLTNLVLVLGAEVDAEGVRLRQLAAGIAAEDVVQLPMRDTRRNLMLARQRADDEAAAAQFRQAQAPDEG
jgi:membrane protein